MSIDLSKYVNGREFHVDNQYSLDASTEDFWDAVYQKAFPGLIRTELVSDVEAQREGIDRVLHMGNGNVFRVDEKKRRRVFSDILLEHTSNITTGSPGWMNKDLAIDYLAYAFMPIKTCYLFPWPMLRRAWLHFGDGWRERYWDTVPGQTSLPWLPGNKSYYTHSVAVPIDVLRAAVGTASIIDVSAELKSVIA